MKKLINFFVLCVISLQILKAQNTSSTQTQALPELVSFYSAVPDKIFEKDVIYLQRTFWSYNYYKNGQKHRLGFFYKNIKKEFNNSPNAMAEYKKSRKAVVNGFWVGIGVGTAISLIPLVDIDNFDDESIDAFGNLGTLTGAFIVANGGFKALNHLERGVFLHNLEVYQKNKK